MCLLHDECRLSHGVTKQVLCFAELTVAREAGTVANPQEVFHNETHYMIYLLYEIHTHYSMYSVCVILVLRGG